MPINFEDLKAQGFIVREKIIAGEKCYLVFPSSLGIKWTKDNLIYRSSIWTADGRPVSLGFKKFFNYGEAPHIVPDFTEQQIKDHTAIPIEKIDGSCLIVSRFGGIVWGELIVRTRGTFDASEHKSTSHEIEYLKKKYPKAFDNPYLSNGSHSYIYEWTTRNNPIVVDYGPEPDIRLIGVINHKYYTYTPQVDLPQIAMDLGLKTAAHGKFKSFDALKLSLADMRKAEGYCVYYNNDQDIKKIKCDWYQTAHKFRSQCTLEHVLDLYISWLSDNYPSLEGFVKSLETAFDFECSDQAKEYASRVDAAYMESLRVINDISKFVDSLSASSKEERKAAAEAINKTYALENKAQFAFTILNKQPLSDRQIKKLIEQHL